MLGTGVFLIAPTAPTMVSAASAPAPVVQSHDVTLLATGDFLRSVVGFFIGNGANAAFDCVGSACNGGNAGILVGNGGNGANGGSGGRAGLLLGNGGNGGNGSSRAILAASLGLSVNGGNGGRAGLFGGTGGNGGNGTDAQYDGLAVVTRVTAAGNGGSGGGSGLLFGNGVAAGNGGQDDAIAV